MKDGSQLLRWLSRYNECEASDEKGFCSDCVDVGG